MATFPSHKPVTGETNDVKVAIIGARPAEPGAAPYCSAMKSCWLNRLRRPPVAPSMLAVGIPTTIVCKRIITPKSRAIANVGVEIKNTMPAGFGKDITSGNLFNDGYRAILFATGAHGGQSLAYPGGKIAIV